VLSYGDTKIRPVAEHLLQLLVRNHRRVVGPLLLSMLGNVVEQGGQPASPPGSAAGDAGATQGRLLLKEAVYHAVGVTSEEMFELVQESPTSFSKLYAGVLVTDLEKGGVYLRRRCHPNQSFAPLSSVFSCPLFFHVTVACLTSRFFPLLACLVVCGAGWCG